MRPYVGGDARRSTQVWTCKPAAPYCAQSRCDRTKTEVSGQSYSGHICSLSLDREITPVHGYQHNCNSQRGPATRRRTVSAPIDGLHDETSRLRAGAEAIVRVVGAVSVEFGASRCGERPRPATAALVPVRRAVYYLVIAHLRRTARVSITSTGASRPSAPPRHPGPRSVRD
ncbi:hypothetical protein OH76DRAFT_1230956 [Lentinus brumalis]|uniref:Uncharacterized protein n=1 Tax=Lentinus brumalis TaxID=2498619 RepID=A0A371CSD5_9APHY|nr:hypothetical protein OH76DRAFT_1230956 [Polyporus brumalis]